MRVVGEVGHIRPTRKSLLSITFRLQRAATCPAETTAMAFPPSSVNSSSSTADRAARPVLYKSRGAHGIARAARRSRRSGRCPRIEVSSIEDGGPLLAAYGHETVWRRRRSRRTMARLQPPKLTRNRGAVVLSLPIALLGLAGLELPGSAASSAHHACDRYAAPHGSNGAPGTAKRPFHTPQRLVDSLHRGQTGCLRGGGYRFSLL